MKKALAVFLVLVVGTLLVQHCWQPDPVKPVSPELRTTVDAMKAEREVLQKVIADKQAQLDSVVARNDSLEAVAFTASQHSQASADSLRRLRLSLRPLRQGPSPRTPPRSSQDTLSLQAQLDTVRLERDLAIQEADTLRASKDSLTKAMHYADSTKAEVLAGFRQVQLAAANFLSGQIQAEGRLNQIIPKVEALEAENVKLRRGCRVPLVGIPCPEVGVGMVVGTDLQPRLGMAVIIPVKL